MEKTLWKNDWISVVEVDGWYTSVRHCADGVLVVGYRRSINRDGSHDDAILCRVEHTPPHGPGKKLTSLTGMIDDGETPLEAAVRELKEESGYTVDPDQVLDMGFVWPLKSSDYKQHLFLIDLTGHTPGEIIGDGTKGEEGASVEWCPMRQAVEIEDPGMQAAILRGMIRSFGRNIYQDVPLIVPF